MTGLKRSAVRTRIERTTRFVCPRCGDDRDGVVIERQRWESVMGVPTVLIAHLESLVECCVCGHRCDLGVLDIPTTELLDEYVFEATRHAVAMVVQAGSTGTGAIDGAVSTAALDAMAAASREYDAAALGRDVEVLDDAAAIMHLGRLVDELTPHGKQGLLFRLVRIAGADGEMTDQQREALGTIGRALRMRTPHINEVLIAI